MDNQDYIARAIYAAWTVALDSPACTAEMRWNTVSAQLNGMRLMAIYHPCFTKTDVEDINLLINISAMIRLNMQLEEMGYEKL